MPPGKMHADEVDTSAALVRRLLVDQFPDWAMLPIKRVPSAGTDNALFRLGDHMVVRLPRYPGATHQVEKELRWLPRLAPHLPLTIPVPLARGKPAHGYPFYWSIHPWLEGQNARLENLADPIQSAIQLADFITALHNIDPTGGPPSGTHNFHRGVPLAERDAQTRAAIESLDGILEPDVLTAAWEADLQAPVGSEPPVWVHGDLQSGNLLALDGRLCAVIDFGGLGVGDPACDLIVAWNLLDPQSRENFRNALDVDEAAWARGRGWALSVSLIALPYYRVTNPVLAGISRYAIRQVLADHWA